MLQKLIKVFAFENKNRSRITLSDSTKIRLNAATHQIELISAGPNLVTGNPRYPTDTNLTVTTWITNPLTVKRWIGFDYEPIVQEQPTGTSIGFKLNNGTSDYYWNGTVWAVAGAANWNTEAEIAAHISTFSATAKRLGVVANLRTTDPSVTPILQRINVLMECEIDYLKSIVEGALVDFLKANIQPTIDFAFDAPGGIYLDLTFFETPFTIAGIAEVYDHTVDAIHVTNLFSAYDSVSKRLTLTAPIARGNTAWLRIRISPEVYTDFPSQDMAGVGGALAIEKVPALILQNFELKGAEIYAKFAVRDVNNNRATQRRIPFRCHLEFEVSLLTEKAATKWLFIEQILQKIPQNVLLHWPAVDEYLELLGPSPVNDRAKASLNDLHEATYRMRLEDIHLWLRADEIVYFVRQFNANLHDPRLLAGVYTRY